MIFHTDTDTVLRPRNGQPVDILRPLTSKEVGGEADLPIVGRMFRVRFADGFETDAFDDELRAS